MARGFGGGREDKHKALNTNPKQAPILKLQYSKGFYPALGLSFGTRIYSGIATLACG
jgi:hypothetical protein